MIFPRLLFSLRRTRDPAWSAILVIEILATEDRFEHPFLVAHDQLILESEQQHRERQKPQDAGDSYESHPHQKVADVKWVPYPCENSVGDESLDIARATSRDGTRSGNSGD